MSATDTPRSDGATVANATPLFWLSCISLIVAAFVFSIRAAIMPELMAEFDLNNEAIGMAAGAAFLGFALTVFVGSPACDFVGMRALLVIAALLHVVGTLATIFTAQLGGLASAYYILWGSMFTVGLAHGLVEAVINPLAATIYPREKTHKLNVLHAWWPGGLVIGGVIAWGIGQMGFNWQVKLSVILLPSVIYLLIVLSQKFPATERVQSGVSHTDMFKEVFKPLFLLILGCMFLTATAELAPNQLLATLSEDRIGINGILVLSYVSAIMFVLRFFAGPIVQRLSPVGLLWGSSVLAGLGLLWLSYSTSVGVTLAAAFVFALGVCYMWPTMLAIASELFPKGGAMAMGMIGTVGNLAIWFALPWMGRITDAQMAGGMAQGEAAQVSFRYVAGAPAILLVGFGLVWMYLASQGGYRAVQQRAADDLQLTQADPADVSAEADTHR